MSKISKFVKLDKNILLEYVYNDGNLISESYDILVNSKDRIRSYMATDSSGTGNTKSNQLFRLDAINNRYGKINPDNYSFLQVNNYSASIPIRHDTLKFHVPINWTFGEYLGFYIKVYTYDTLNQVTYDISNFYFDMTDVSQQYLMNYTSPPLLFQEKLWGKNIKIEAPAISEIAAQRVDNRPKENSINANLTSGNGLSLTSPIFIDFQFITNIQTINGITTYLTTPKVTTTIPQNPEFERLGLKVEHSVNGDFFEIYSTYNDTIAGFKQFIDDSVTQGNRYYAQYNITLYEQNIRGKTVTVNVTDNFNETIEYRPIIKYSTTTAIIDVEMRLIDAVDDSYIIRKASYGILQDEVSKYSLNLMKINLTNAYKPKIYNIKNNIDPSLIGRTNNRKVSTGITPTKSTTVETVKVPFPVLIDRFNIISKSENALFNSKVFYGIGKMQVLIYPFDNILKFNIATGEMDSPKYLDMTGYGEIKLTIKSSVSTLEFPLFTESGDIELSIGQLAFKLDENKFSEIKRTYESGINLFYITSYNKGLTSVVYTGLYKVYDSLKNVNELNNQAASTPPTIIQDPKLPKETAIVTRQLVSNQPIPKSGTN
jgi:hypothetical protein